MSMQLRVVHTTSFAYDGKAVASYNQARLTPLTTPEQILVHQRFDVSPKPWTHSYRDYFGNEVTAFEVVDPHQAMTVTATSTVQVDRRPGTEPTLDWAELTSPAVADRWVEFLMLSELVAPPEEYADRVAQIAAEAARPSVAAHAVCELVAAEVRLVEGATQATSPAGEAWTKRAGAGQDMTHLVIGGLRSAGIPARYVSGYVHPTADPAVGESAVGGSHAWLEWWDDGWHPLDPINSAEPDDTYVAVAVGRDYADVRPLAGIYSGADTSTLSVTVQVTRLS
ncbi:MAG: transglutaminase family protein [Nocardioides sp.]|uniref:transglutaminase family protein n=1 Tax=Nocardioides sp. TaxID=35761 RepID=UPI0039E5081E